MYIVITQTDFAPRIVGPFPSHSAANQWMQVDYDRVLEAVGDVEFSDDTDASCFTIGFDSENEQEWLIVDEIEVP